MELYPHNQKAYENAVSAFNKTNRTCIVHPTGSGKSLIIAKFIKDNPGKKHLLLAPSSHIEYEIKKHTGGLFDFYTYHGLGQRSGVNVGVDYDFIYLDEFHRIGANQWGKNAMEVINSNASAKILGTSATHIRYLDDQRNMASEIFSDNIASSMSLLKAINEEVLRPPRYISALYSLKEDAEHVIKKINESNHPDKDGLIEKINANIIDWQKTSGIDSIFKKHLLPSRKKIIVFCKNLSHMVQTKKILMPIFRNIWVKSEAIDVFSKFGEDHNTESLRKFSEESQHAKILFTIDKLNEGLHVSGANTVILMRNTVSPIVFYQQIGRCFSVGQNQNPLIFDLVNNFASARIEEFRSDFIREQGSREGVEYGLTNKVSIDFVDEIKQWGEIFQDILSEVETWEVRYQQAKEYFIEHGGLNVPVENQNLYKWLKRQKIKYNEGTLDYIYSEKLNALNINWNIIDNDDKFESKYKELVEYYSIHQRLPTKRENKKLGLWIQFLRASFVSNKLSAHKINILSPFITFGNAHDNSWNTIFEELKELIEKTGTTKIPKSNQRLWRWACTQRARRTNLSEDRIEKLESIGFQLKYTQNKPKK